MSGDFTETPNHTTKNRFFRQKTQNDDIELQSCGNQENAVVVTNAFKHYGSLPVLDNLNMKVPKGSIYALLGASGCGKTTLLGCLVGRKRLVSGHVSVLGDKPGSEILTTKIGYMPQETGLHRGFTIEEVLMFFGRVLGIQGKVIKARTEFLVELLMLPGSNHNISELSGGEQRRVSLAIAFLHEPELLILDEPTVGTDPIVREVIWKHFLDITKTKNLTIIITTHYIEETSQADIVGFMRGGYLVAEDKLETLLKQYKLSSLEDVFLKLSIEQKTSKHEIANKLPNVYLTNYLTVPSVKLDRVNALIWKHCLWLRKNFSQVAATAIFPVLLIIISCLTIGGDPFNLKVAVVNGERLDQHCNDTISCDSNEISCIYLKYLERRGLVLLPYRTEQDAIKSVQQGETYASIVIQRNYSKALRTRAHDWYRVKDNDLEQSTIDVFRDVSNNQVSMFIQMYLVQSYETFLFEYVEACGLRRKEVAVPLQINSLHHGLNSNFSDFCTPPNLVSICFVLAQFMTAWIMLLEKKEASLERTLVVGINKNELLLSHTIVQFVILAVQILFMTIFTFAIFGMTSKGSLVPVVIMLFLTGFAGIITGLLISCVCDSEVGVSAIAIGFFFMSVFTSGLIWPIEALHPWLKPFGPFFPLTKPTESLRLIMHRGWSFFDQDVYVGFLVIIAWSVVTLLINILFLKF